MGAGRGAAASGMTTVMVQEDHSDLEARPDGKRPRKCTDPWNIPLFVFGLVGLGYILHYASENGDIRRVYHGLDFQNNLCGVSPGFEDKPLLYWCSKSGSSMDANALIAAGLQTTMADEVGSNLSLTGLNAVLTATSDLDIQHPICVPSCPSGYDTFSSCFIEETFQDLAKLPTGTFSRNVTFHFGFVEDYPSYSLAQRYCLPSDNVMLKQLSGTLSWGAEAAMFHILEVMESWEVLLGAGFVAFILGYLYLFLVAKIAGPVVYLTIALSALFSCGFGGWMLYGVFAEDIDMAVVEHLKNATGVSEVPYVPTTGIKEADITISIFLFVLGVAIAVAGCCMRKSIELVLGSLEATVEALTDMPFLLLQPLVSVTIRCSYLAIAFLGFAWVASVGDVATWDVSPFVPSGLTRSFTYQDNEMYFVLGYCFMAIWILELGRALEQIVLAYATQVWFFAPYKNGKKRVSIMTLPQGIGVGLTYHLGTLVFGSLLMTLFQVVYFVVALIIRQLKSAGDGAVNQAAVAAAGACLCCLKCLEDMIRYMNKNVYTVVIVTSDHFCVAVGTVLNIFSEDFAALGLLEGVTKVFQIGGVISITGAGSLLTWLVLRNFATFTDPASQYAVPQPEVVTAAAGVLCFGISMIFMNIFDVISDTILLCWSLDKRYRKQQGLGSNPDLPGRLRDLLDEVSSHQDEKRAAFSGSESGSESS